MLRSCRARVSTAARLGGGPCAQQRGARSPPDGLSARPRHRVVAVLPGTGLRARFPPRAPVKMASYRKIALAAVAAQIMIVVTGAAVRLTGSGLGCTDWPGCSSDRFVPEWGFHHWVEFGNRLLIILLIASAVVATVAARRLRPARRDLVWLAAALIAGVFAQAIIGAVVVVLDLDPRLTLTHFLLSMVLI